MLLSVYQNHFLSSAREVLLLFLIPIGGGIPGGVLLAKARGLAWPVVMALYFISDIILACVFEPILLLFVKIGKHSAKIGKIVAAFRASTAKIVAKHGVKPGPFTLVMISFGVDPMTGRSATKMVGHGFITGWLIAILGDMIFFTILMVSTLWLNNILGDGTWTAVLILAAMFLLPPLIRRIRGSWQKKKG